MKSKKPQRDEHREPTIISLSKLYTCENIDRLKGEVEDLIVAMPGDRVFNDTGSSDPTWQDVIKIDAATSWPIMEAPKVPPSLPASPMLPTLDLVESELLNIRYDDVVLYSEVLLAMQQVRTEDGYEKLCAIYRLPVEWGEALGMLFACLQTGRNQPGPGSTCFDWRINVIAASANGTDPAILKEMYTPLLVSPVFTDYFNRFIAQGQEMYQRRCVIQNTQEAITSLLGVYFSLPPDNLLRLPSYEYQGKKTRVVCTSKDDRLGLHPILAMILDLVDMHLWNKRGGLSYLLGYDCNGHDDLGYDMDYLGREGEVEYPSAIVLPGDRGLILLSRPTHN